jgi:hypothetical protein
MMGGYYTGTTTAAFGGLAAKKENATDGNFGAYLQFLTSTHGVGNTEKMRIDSSGNLMVGKTSLGIGITGTEVRAGGQLLVTADADNPADFNRKTSDGVIALFRKDSSTVGSIGTISGDVTIDGGSEHTGLRFEATDITPRHNGAASDGVNDLGTSAARFKDLYLSGGVQFGTTGAAAQNLDDYEEGTWTPVVRGSASNPTVSYASAQGTYTKVGNVVTVSCYIALASISGGSGNTHIGGLPFNQTTTNNAHLGNSALLIDGLGGDGKQASLQGGSTDELVIIINGGGTAVHSGIAPTSLGNTSAIRFIRTYFV